MEHYITLELLNNTSPLNRKRRLKYRSYLISKLYKIVDLLFHLCDKLRVFSETQAEQSCSFSAALPLTLNINPNMASHNRHRGVKQISDLASSLRLSLYAEVERTLKGSEDESICNASAKRLFLSKVAHSWSHSSLRKHRISRMTAFHTSAAVQSNPLNGLKNEIWPSPGNYLHNYFQTRAASWPSHIRTRLLFK